MEVILREHVEHLGAPRRRRQGRRRLRAELPAAAQTGAWWSARTTSSRSSAEKKLAEVKDLEDQRAAEAVAERIGELDIDIGRRVGDNDTLYGSVTSADVAAALKAKGFDIDKRKIVMPEPLKALGENTIPNQDPPRRRGTGQGAGGGEKKQ